MSVRDDLSYKLTRDNVALTVTRTISSDIGSALDLPIPNGSVNLPATFAITLATLKSLFAYSDQAITLTAGGVNAVQRVAITGAPTGGSFTLTKGGNTTAAIAWNATAAIVQAALQLLASVGSGGVTCTGGPLPGTPIDCTFTGANATMPVSLMTDVSTLTGGTTPDANVTSLTTGVVPATTLPIKANVPLIWDSQGYFANPFSVDVAILRASNISGVDASLKIRTLSSAS
jgi:hypothetical protein